MKEKTIPSFCKACIQRLQAACPHLHISTYGSFHYTEGEVWDDLVDICDDCGANLAELHSAQQEAADQETIPY